MPRGTAKMTEVMKFLGAINSNGKFNMEARKNKGSKNGIGEIIIPPQDEKDGEINVRFYNRDNPIDVLIVAHSEEGLEFARTIWEACKDIVYGLNWIEPQKVKPPGGKI